MFSFNEVIDAFKSASVLDPTMAEIGYCRTLDRKAVLLGYRDYHDFRASLEHMPKDELGPVSLRLMRKICAARLPLNNSQPYFELKVLPNGIAHYSQWEGWDKFGQEVRVPRPLEGAASVEAVRRLGRYPVYVIEAERELIAWRGVWQSTAYVRSDLARKNFPRMFNKRHLIADDVPVELIRLAAARCNFDSNIAMG
ncbi:hypothetical protein [Stenotrophomonas maltophilia]|uniref:hypothetical protein n=1 Tax=Stenotrophomonas maltophilia TaxID=40324 RepID=UPI0015F232FD|nr:hypothetical protein [Stenotrophomonas maltophilia]QDY51255.1 hypothetical protein DUW70_23410 [Stenotrophomonas maltophilia]